MNDIFYYLSNGALCNFADDNTDELLLLLKTNTNKCLDWFKLNEMTANPSKFQAIAIGNKGKHIEKLKLTMNLR